MARNQRHFFMPFWPSDSFWNIALQTVSYLSCSTFVSPVLRGRCCKHSKRVRSPAIFTEWRNEGMCEVNNDLGSTLTCEGHGQTEQKILLSTISASWTDKSKPLRYEHCSTYSLQRLQIVSLNSVHRSVFQRPEVETGWQRLLRLFKKNILNVNAFGRNSCFLRHIPPSVKRHCPIHKFMCLACEGIWTWHPWTCNFKTSISNLELAKFPQRPNRMNLTLRGGGSGIYNFKKLFRCCGFRWSAH